MNKWKPTATMDYYYRDSDGRILGAVWHFAMNSDVYSSKIFTEEYPFTNESEKYLGHFVNKDSALKSVELYWFKQSNTLEYDENSNK